MSKLTYFSSKTYDHSIGLSCCFRQWRAQDSHCRFLHGYALKVDLLFKAEELDHRNWVVDFGGLKEIKEWLQSTFDHKTVIAADDPLFETFAQLHHNGAIDLCVMSHVGCEKFAEVIFEYVENWLEREGLAPRVSLATVKVNEHAGNSAAVSRR